MKVDPNNRLVADALEANWNDRLRALEAAREERERGRQADSVVLDDVVRAHRIRAHLTAMAADFKQVWTDQTTPNRERKRLLAHVVEDVTLVKHADDGTTRIHVRFKGGSVATLTTENPKSLPPGRTVKLGHGRVRVCEARARDVAPEGSSRGSPPRVALDWPSRFNWVEASRTWSSSSAKARGLSPGGRPRADWPRGSCAARAIAAARNNRPLKTSNDGRPRSTSHAQRPVAENVGQILDGQEPGSSRKRAGMVPRRSSKSATRASKSTRRRLSSSA